MKYIEILLFLFNFAFFLQIPIFQQLIFNNICTETYNVTVDICYTNAKLNSVVSKTSSTWAMWLSLAQMFPYILSVFVINFMSSKYSPDNVLWIPCVSIAVSTLISIYYTFVPSLSMLTYILLAIIPSFLGGMGAFRSLANIYISSTTSEQNRTSKFITIEAVTLVALALSGILSGYLIKNFGFFIPQLIVLGVMLSNIPLSYLLDRAISGKKTHVYNVRKTLGMTLKSFNPAAVLIIVATVANGFGEVPCQRHVMLYAMNSKFNFTATSGGYLLGAYSLTRGLGSLLMLPLLLNYFKVSEWKLCSVVSFFQIGFYLMNAFAVNRDYLFIAPLFLTLQDVFKGVFMSTLSKIFSGQPRTIIFAFQTTSTMVLVNIGTVLINYCYKMTIDFFPGLVYLIFGSVSFVATIIGTIGVYLARNQQLYDKSANAPSFILEVEAEET